MDVNITPLYHHLEMFRALWTISSNHIQVSVNFNEVYNTILNTNLMCSTSSALI
jgi:hypothetical protein